MGFRKITLRRVSAPRKTVGGKTLKAHKKMLSKRSGVRVARIK